MRLYLIRHAESANNVLYNGGESAETHTPDPTITETGHKQAEQLAEFLSRSNAEPIQHPFEQSDSNHFGLTHLYCSLMSRSLMTAEYISNGLGLKQTALPDIYEKYGLYEIDGEGKRVGVTGPNVEQLKHEFPNVDFPDDLNPQGWWSRDAETTPEFIERVNRAVDTIRQKHGNTKDRIGMVVHGDFIDQFINALYGVNRHSENYAESWVSNWTFHNTSISRIDLGVASSNVIYMNRIDHLPANLVTW